MAGIGFTVSLLIASLALSGTELAEAKLGILSAAVAASGLTWVVFQAGEPAADPDPTARAAGHERGHHRPGGAGGPGPGSHPRSRSEAPVTVVEYGDFECPYCGQAEPAVRELLRDFGDVRYVWRHLPLTDVHPEAQLAAEAAEAAGRQGAFWEMHDLLLDHQDALRPRDLIGYAASLGLDTDRFAADLRKHAGAAHVSEDVDSADLSNVSGTPTFFVNGKRHYGAYDIQTLKKAVKLAAARTKISALFPATRFMPARLTGLRPGIVPALEPQRTLISRGKMKRTFAATRDGDCSTEAAPSPSAGAAGSPARQSAQEAPLARGRPRPRLRPAAPVRQAFLPPRPHAGGGLPLG